MEDDLEGTYSTLKVEVSVSAGKNAGVCFTTVIEVPKDDRKKATSLLRDAACLLRSALPIAEIKADEEEDDSVLALSLDGKPVMIPQHLREILKAQEKLKKEIMNGSSPIPPTEPRAQGDSR